MQASPSQLDPQQFPPPPSFGEAKTRHHKVRAAGLDPNYWYIAAVADDMQRGDKREIKFWKRSLVLFRDKRGDFHTLENRCAHRQVRLSESGVVEGCNLVCQYHGWKYNGEGRVVEIWHETFGHKDPKFKVPHVPTKVKYGLVWIFPGDPELAESRPIPNIPEAEPGSGWIMVPKEYHWKAHHSMVLENVSDYTHGYLHRKYEPFSEPKLVACEDKGDAVHIAYQAKVGAGKIMDQFMDRPANSSGKMHLGYDYPYNWSNTDEYIKHFVSIIPEDETHSHLFFVLFVRSLKIPFTKLKIPNEVMKRFMPIGMKFQFDPVFEQDREALEWEMDGYLRNWHTPMAELSPAVKAFQDLTIRKWQEYLDRQAAGKTAKVKAAAAPGKTTAGKSKRKAPSAVAA